jgi:hypothetical protein
MSLSRFLSSTSVAGTVLGLATATAAAGCGDDSCGPGGAPAVGLVASGSAVTLTYGQLTGSLNNDCPDAAAPAGVVSLSIEGAQSDGQGRITLCVGRPDLLAKQPLTLGNTASAQVRVVDFAGTANNCAFAIDATGAPSGTASSSGMCGNGSDAAGFALVLDGSLPLTRTCGTTVDSLSVTLRGRVAVHAVVAAK